MNVTSRSKLLSTPLFSTIGVTTRQYCLVNTIRFLSKFTRDDRCSENDEATLYVHVSKYFERLNQFYPEIEFNKLRFFYKSLRNAAGYINNT